MLAAVWLLDRLANAAKAWICVDPGFKTTAANPRPFVSTGGTTFLPLNAVVKRRACPGVGEGVAVAEPVGVPDGVPVDEAVGEPLGVPVGEWDGVAEPVGVGVAVQPDAGTI